MPLDRATRIAVARRFSNTVFHHALMRCEEEGCELVGVSPEYLAHVDETGHGLRWSVFWPDAPEGQIIGRMQLVDKNRPRYDFPPMEDPPMEDRCP